MTHQDYLALRPGDRVRLVPAGACSGTVSDVTSVGVEQDWRRHYVTVTWDDGRKLTFKPEDAYLVFRAPEGVETQSNEQ